MNGICPAIARPALTLLVLLGVVACASSGQPELTPADVHVQPAWGPVDNVTRVSRLYFSGQPDAEALRAAAAEGVEVVINLREPGESDFDEASAAAEAGQLYYNVPVSRKGESFDPEAMERIGELVRQHPGQKVLLHCRTGQRATSWLAIHLVEDHGLTPQQSLAVAGAAGLDSESLLERVQRYLQAF